MRILFLKNVKNSKLILKISIIWPLREYFDCQGVLLVVS